MQLEVHRARISFKVDTATVEAGFPEGPEVYLDQEAGVIA